MTLDSIRVALRGVLANRLRSALTMLGILIGTSAVILLVGVGTGISDGVQNQIKALGTNAIYVIPERNARGRDRGGTSARRIRLTADDVKALSDKVRVPDSAETLVNSDDLIVSPPMNHLYRYLREAGRIVPIDPP